MNKHGKIFFLKIFLIVLTTLMVIGTILIGFNYARQTGRDIPNAISYSMGTVLLFCILTGIFSVIKSTRKNLVYIAFIIALLCLVGRANFNLQKAIELAASIAARAPVAVRVAKDAVNMAFEGSLAAGLAYERNHFYALFATEDQREGMAAFLEKRQPNWRGQ